MKKLIYPAILCVVLSFAACDMFGPSPIGDSFYARDLIGTWKRTGVEQDIYVCFTSEYDSTYEYRFGYEWNESEDIFPEDLKKYGDGWFKWKVLSPKLTEIHLMDNGGADIPKVYTLLKLTESELSYKDDFNRYDFVKVVVKEDPKDNPKDDPKDDPKDNPTDNPATDQPTENPTTDQPTENPTTDQPTENPTTDQPTENPTENPTDQPTEQPTDNPEA